MSEEERDNLEGEMEPDEDSLGGNPDEEDETM